VGIQKENHILVKSLAPFGEARILKKNSSEVASSSSAGPLPRVLEAIEEAEGPGEMWKQLKSFCVCDVSFAINVFLLKFESPSKIISPRLRIIAPKIETEKTYSFLLKKIK
jgi:hypothetical protein